jgi:hypothetical protein
MYLINLKFYTVLQAMLRIGEIEVRDNKLNRKVLFVSQREQVPILNDEEVKASLEEVIVDGFRSIAAMGERPTDGIYPIWSYDNGKIFQCELSVLSSGLKFPMVNINPGGQCQSLNCRNKFHPDFQCAECLQAYCSQECRVADAVRHTNDTYSNCKSFQDLFEPFLDKDQNGK